MADRNEIAETSIEATTVHCTGVSQRSQRCRESSHMHRHEDKSSIRHPDAHV